MPDTLKRPARAALLPALLLPLHAIALGASEMPARTIPECVGINIKNHSCAPEHLEGVKQSSATFIRRGFYWQAIEKEKGVYDFSGYDALLKEADSRGLRVLGVLFGNNPVHEDDKRGGVQTEAGRKGYAAFGAALAKHFKGRGILWEIWNEPNTKTFWRQDVKAGNNAEFATEYTLLVKETVAAMLAEDPEVFVMAGSVSCLWEPSFFWTNACFEQGILKSGIKAWSIHPYGFKHPEQHLGGYAKVRELLAKHGAPDFPLINSERGFAVAKSKEGWSGGPVELAQTFQAWHVVRQTLLDRMSEIRLSIWYEWEMKPGDKEDFGLVSGAEKRPAHRALVAMTEQLRGYAFKQRIETPNAQDFLLVFENAAGALKLAAWTSPQAKEGPDQAVAHDVELALEGAAEAEVFDLFGQGTKQETPGGRLKLKLSGSLVYVALPAGGAKLP